MVDNARTDEGLIEAYRLGDLEALDVLFKRYEPTLRPFILNLSWLKDASFIDDIIQLTLLAIFEGIKKDKFDPRKGSFKRWAYGICQHICMEENRKRRRLPRLLSERYPEELPNGLLAVRSKTSTGVRNLERITRQLNEILKPLAQEERKLLWLMSQDKTYKEICSNVFWLPTPSNFLCS